MDPSDIIERHTRGLAKNFDCVVILASYYDEDGETMMAYGGHGNKFARIALADRFVRNHNENQLARKLAVALEEVFDFDDDDDDDDDEDSDTLPPEAMPPEDKASS
jgi:hypothetical protein